MVLLSAALLPAIGAVITKKRSTLSKATIVVADDRDKGVYMHIFSRDVCLTSPYCVSSSDAV